MTDAEATDAELVARILRGEEPAFTALMRRHKSWLYLFIRRHTPNAEDAYDILQDSFASAWGALKRYDPERPFDIWLRRIALNKCRDRGRKESVRRRFFSLIGASPETLAQAPDPAAAVDEAQIANETLRRLDEAVKQLPAGLREPLVLTALQGLSQREAAQVLGVTPKVVEMRAYRARRRLAEVLDRADVEDLTER